MSDFTADELIAHTAEHFPELSGPDMEVIPILKGGSDRKYYRLRKHGRAVQLILVRYTDARPDNASFFPATDILHHAGVRVPRVRHHDKTLKLAWIEDLGTLDLWAFQHSPAAERRRLYEKTLLEAVKIHRLQPGDCDPALTAQLMPAFNQDMYLWEQNYFFDNFVTHFSTLSPAARQTVRDGDALRDLRTSLGALPRHFVHRDFQSQNVIIRDGEPYFIDYQGLRPGRPEYDVASLLLDPYVALPAAERVDLWDYYKSTRASDAWETSDTLYAQCACQRLMQALGAYGNLALNLHRPEFLTHIPRAVENLAWVIHHYHVLPELLPLLELQEEMLA